MHRYYIYIDGYAVKMISEDFYYWLIGDYNLFAQGNEVTIKQAIDLIKERVMFNQLDSRDNQKHIDRCFNVILPILYRNKKTDIMEVN